MRNFLNSISSQNDSVHPKSNVGIPCRRVGSCAWWSSCATSEPCLRIFWWSCHFPSPRIASPKPASKNWLRERPKGVKIKEGRVESRLPCGIWACSPRQSPRGSCMAAAQARKLQRCWSWGTSPWTTTRASTQHWASLPRRKLAPSSPSLQNSGSEEHLHSRRLQYPGKHQHKGYPHSDHIATRVPLSINPIDFITCDECSDENLPSPTMYEQATFQSFNLIWLHLFKRIPVYHHGGRSAVTSFGVRASQSSLWPCKTTLSSLCLSFSSFFNEFRLIFFRCRDLLQLHRLGGLPMALQRSMGLCCHTSKYMARIFFT